MQGLDSVSASDAVPMLHPVDTILSNELTAGIISVCRDTLSALSTHLSVCGLNAIHLSVCGLDICLQVMPSDSNGSPSETMVQHRHSVQVATTTWLHMWNYAHSNHSLQSKMMVPIVMHIYINGQILNVTERVDTNVRRDYHTMHMRDSSVECVRLT